mmetsp:Transcript_485/g.1414  ORF Transcript_485/g.1414 Transcript_485/m.1414 type:complete len:202 (+) Transcript_485:224-829(+)
MASEASTPLSTSTASACAASPLTRIAPLVSRCSTTPPPETTVHSTECASARSAAASPLFRPLTSATGLIESVPASPSARRRSRRTAPERSSSFKPSPSPATTRSDTSTRSRSSGAAALAAHSSTASSPPSFDSMPPAMYAPPASSAPCSRGRPVDDVPTTTSAWSQPAVGASRVVACCSSRPLPSAAASRGAVDAVRSIQS